MGNPSKTVSLNLFPLVYFMNFKNNLQQPDLPKYKLHAFREALKKLLPEGNFI